MCTVRLNVWWHIGLYCPEMAEPGTHGGLGFWHQILEDQFTLSQPGGEIIHTTLLLAPFSQHFGPSAVPAYVLATQLLEMFTLEIQVKQMLLDSIRCDLGRLNDVSWLYLQKITISSKKILPSSNNVRIKSLGRVKKKLSLIWYPRGKVSTKRMLKYNIQE